jgi:p-methyltransferase
VDLVVDGELLDFSRFLSLVQFDTTAEWQRYDPFAMTLLAGSYYLSFLSRHGFTVRVANAATRPAVARLGATYDPRFVLLSTTLLFDGGEHELVRAAVDQIRHTWPEAIVVLGGLMLVSYRNNLPRPVFHQLLRHYGADVYIVSAQGEVPLLEVLKRGCRKALQDAPPIPNAWLLADGSVVEPDSGPEPVLPLDDNYIRWRSLPQIDHLYHTVHMRTARSCAFKCAFCEYPVNQGPLTLMPLEVVDRELRELQALGTIKSLVFTDDTFNVPLQRFKELLKLLARYDFEWYSFFRPQYVDDETAYWMKESHCRAIFAGLEAADDQVLKNMHKVATVDAYRRGLEQLKKQGIHIHANFIVGFPGDTEQSARKITGFLNELDVEFCTVCTWVYLPSTPVGRTREEWQIEGLGMDWTHKTMTSGEAQVLAREVVSGLTHSVHNAVRGEAWSEFLLYANGFSVEEARLAVSMFNQFLGRDVGEDEIRHLPQFAALRSILAKHQLPLPSA